mmetsp:Transcript_43040/g.131059  ORF Transcript_43040/g.131059 Transcript_43040/m.131059 type:complete len:218 (-) Transcript_43040:274-927(-)
MPRPSRRRQRERRRRPRLRGTPRDAPNAPPIREHGGNGSRSRGRLKCGGHRPRLTPGLRLRCGLSRNRRTTLATRQRSKTTRRPNGPHSRPWEWETTGVTTTRGRLRPSRTRRRLLRGTSSTTKVETPRSPFHPWSGSSRRDRIRRRGRAITNTISNSINININISISISTAMLTSSSSSGQCTGSTALTMAFSTILTRRRETLEEKRRVWRRRSRQ